MIAVGGAVVVVGAGAVVVGAGAVVVGAVGGGKARREVVSSRSAEPATEMPVTRSAATTNATSTGGRKTCLRECTSRRSGNAHRIGAGGPAGATRARWARSGRTRHRNLTARSRVLG